jgi:Alpha/beta hydrolase family
MATYAVIHGAADSGASWDLVAERLRARGHAVVAPDLPCEDDGAGFEQYAEVVAGAVAAARRGHPPAGGQLVVVAHSLGGFTAPLVCELLAVDLLVLVSAMVPRPGESAGAWWEATGCVAAQRAAQARGGWGDDAVAQFLHDVPPPVAEQALASARDQSGTPMATPHPLAAWPDVPTRFLLCRDDRFFPPEWMRGVVRERLGIEPDEIAGSHAVYLSRPGSLAARLEAFRAEVAPPPHL